jgi:hypothetical protein
MDPLIYKVFGLRAFLASEDLTQPAASPAAALVQDSTPSLTFAQPFADVHNPIAE